MPSAYVIMYHPWAIIILSINNSKRTRANTQRPLVCGVDLSNKTWYFTPIPLKNLVTTFDWDGLSSVVSPSSIIKVFMGFPSFLVKQPPNYLLHSMSSSEVNWGSNFNTMSQRVTKFSLSQLTDWNINNSLPLFTAPPKLNSPNFKLLT